MSRLSRRGLVQAAAGAAASLPFGGRFAIGQPARPEIVVAAAQPLTGVFSFAGASLHAGLGDYCAWRNAAGGVAGRQLRYVAEDTGFKVDQGVAVFKKLMASEKPSFFYGDRTEWSKAVAREALASGTVMTGSASLAGAMADPQNMPHHFISGPSYGAMHEVLMETIAREAGSGPKPNVALMYTDTEFGTDGIRASKARAEKLGLPIVAELVTKQSGIDVAAEVSRLRRSRPDIIVAQGYIVAPVAELYKQLREAGLKSRVLGTMWMLDHATYDGVAGVGERLEGVAPYRYSHDTESPMLGAIRDHLAKNRPGMGRVSIFYLNAWLTGMIYAEVAERCITADKPLTQPNMTAALRSITNWDAGGIVGLPVDLSGHQISSGRLYRYSPDLKRMEPASDWIRV